MSARRFFVTGTDTDVGKTRVTAALAHALKADGLVRIVKPVQTGLEPDVAGDAHDAARLAGCAFAEIARYRLPADPWNAALAEGREPPHVAKLAAHISAFSETLVIEGAGGIAVPLNAAETYADLARALDARTIVVVGLKLGCINHARLTLAFLAQAKVAVAGIVFCERFGPVGDSYRTDATRALASHAPLLASLPHDTDDGRALASASAALRALVAR